MLLQSDWDCAAQWEFGLNRTCFLQFVDRFQRQIS